MPRWDVRDGILAINGRVRSRPSSEFFRFIDRLIWEVFERFKCGVLVLASWATFLEHLVPDGAAEKEIQALIEKSCLAGAAPSIAKLRYFQLIFQNFNAIFGLERSNLGGTRSSF